MWLASGVTPKGSQPCAEWQRTAASLHQQVARAREQFAQHSLSHADVETFVRATLHALHKGRELVVQHCPGGGERRRQGDAAALARARALATCACAHVLCTSAADYGQLCSGCGTVRYCGEACQAADWRAHRRACRLLAAEQAESASEEECD